jgi:cysteine synthase A
VKLKTAVALVDEAERSGRPFPKTRLIESTSGSLGVALSMVCAARGYRLTCVTDPNCLPAALRAMHALGAEVVVIEERDAAGGYLRSRIDYISTRLHQEPDLYWLNQYTSRAGPRAHHDQTARAILTELGHVDALFVGAGTTGTLMGCAEYFRTHSPHTRIIAVDTVGSVTFGHPPGRRHLPGLGTSRRPEILDRSMVDDVVLVDEANAVRACRQLALRRGLLLGGSSGSVLWAVSTVGPRLRAGSVITAIAPDMGDRYLDTIYRDEWVDERWPGMLSTNRETDHHLASL